MSDEKVISRTILSFEKALPHQNKYLILIPNKVYQCRYVKISFQYVYYVVYGSKDFWNIVGDCSQYKNIIIHFLSLEASKFILKIDHPSITWIVWGADLYNEFLVGAGFNLYADKKLVENCMTYNACGQRHLNLIKYVYHKIPFLVKYVKKFMAKRHNQIEYKAIKKITYVCIANGDLKLLRHFYPKLDHLRQKQFFYYSIDEIIPKKLLNSSELGDNIIIGNSASFTNNHTYVIDALSKADYNDRTILMPLSYGGNNEYVKKIEDYGKEKLGKNYKPILDFFPLNEYNKLLLSCRTFIYGNFRQEAVGNILVGFYIGAVIFLDDSSPLLEDFKDEGFTIYGLSELPKKVNYKLSKEEKVNNRKLTLKIYDTDRQIKLIQGSFS